MAKFSVLVKIFRKTGQSQRWVTVNADSMYMATMLAENKVAAESGVLKASAIDARAIK